MKLLQRWWKPIGSSCKHYCTRVFKQLSPLRTQYSTVSAHFKGVNVMKRIGIAGDLCAVLVIVVALSSGALGQDDPGHGGLNIVVKSAVGQPVHAGIALWRNGSQVSGGYS